MADTMTPAEKQRLRTALLKHLGQGEDALADGIEAQQEVLEAPFDEDTSRDDQWQAQVASDMQVALQENADQVSEERHAAKDLDFSDTDEVRPGAVVGMDGQRYVVGVVLDELTVDGASYSGISEDSPLYQEMQGLKAGDEFGYEGQHHRIDFVA